MSALYGLIPRVRVQGANAQAAWWVINTAPVMAAVLFGHALGRQLGEAATGTALIHHAAQLHGEMFRRFLPEQRRGAVFIDSKDYSSKNKHALSLQPTASFSGEFSLVVRFAEEAEIDEAAVLAFLGQARLSGGLIIGHGAPVLTASASDVRRQVRSGYWLIDRRDLLEPLAGEDRLDALLRLTARRPHADGVPSWLAATTVGYAGLTKAQLRAGAREGYPHIFAEPLVGLVQYVSIREWGEQPLPIWESGWPQDDVFLLSQANQEE